MIELRHLSKAQFLARLREDYRSAEGERATKLATLILRAIDEQFCSDDEMRMAFGKSVADWARMKQTVLVPQASARSAVRGARGE